MFIEMYLAKPPWSSPSEFENEVNEWTNGAKINSNPKDSIVKRKEDCEAIANNTSTSTSSGNIIYLDLGPNIELKSKISSSMESKINIFPGK